MSRKILENNKIFQVNNIGNRIKELREIVGKGRMLVQKKFADSIGVSQGTISEIEAGNTLPSNPILLAIESVYGVRKEWIETGEGDIFKKEESKGDKDDYDKVPLVEGKIAAGSGRVIHKDEIKSYVWIYSPKLQGRSFRVLRIKDTFSDRYEDFDLSN